MTTPSESGCRWDVLFRLIAPGLARQYLVGNKITNDEEIKFLEENTPGIPLLGTLPALPGVIEADRLGISVYDHVPELREAAEKMAQKIKELERGQTQ